MKNCLRIVEEWFSNTMAVIHANPESTKISILCMCCSTLKITKYHVTIKRFEMSLKTNYGKL